MSSKIGSLIAIFVVTGLLLGLTVGSGWSPLLGLDLQGGVSVVLQPVDGSSEEDLDDAVGIIRRRVDSLGVAEPEITRQGDSVVVELPGVDNKERALELVGQTAEVRFRPVLCRVFDESAVTLPDPTIEVDPTATTIAGDTESDGTESEDGEPPETTVTPTTVTATTTATEDEVGISYGIGGGESAMVFQAEEPTTTTEAPATTVAEDADESEGDAPTTTVDDDLVLDPEELESLIAPAILQQQGSDNDVCASGLGTATPPEGDTPEATVVLPGSFGTGQGQLFVLGPVELTGEALAGATATTDGINWTVNPTFKSGAQGIDLFNAAASKCNLGDPTCPAIGGEPGALGIVLDGSVVSAPTIRVPTFQRDQVTISGAFSEQEANDLALVLRHGALPIELEAQQTQTVSASLGEDSLRAGLIAGAIGLMLVGAYMVFYYRLLGVIAMVSLAISGSLLWSIISWLGESQGLALTLAGVTGIIVSIGVSLDSNVVYFEHLKADVREGRTIRSSSSRSFTSAFRTIVSADVASLIGAILLYLLTVGSVRGFALMLAISTVLDLIASYFFMRPAVIALGNSDLVQRKPRMMGLPKAPSTGEARLAAKPGASNAAGAN